MYGYPNTTTPFVRFAPYRRRQNEQTTKWYFISSFWKNSITRYNEKKKTKPNDRKTSFCDVFALCWSRQNEHTTKRTSNHDKSNLDMSQFPPRFVAPSCFGKGDKMNKRQNKIPIRRFGDLYIATKRTHKEMKFCFVVPSFVRFGALTNATKQSNDKMKFRFVVYATNYGCCSISDDLSCSCTTLQIEHTTKLFFYFVLSFFVFGEFVSYFVDDSTIRWGGDLQIKILYLCFLFLIPGYKTRSNFQQAPGSILHTLIDLLRKTYRIGHLRVRFVFCVLFSNCLDTRQRFAIWKCLYSHSE